MIIVVDFNTPLSTIVKTTRWRISTDTELIIIKQQSLIDIFRASHQTRILIIFESPKTYVKTDHILVHKANVNKLRISEIIPCMFSDCNRIKLETNKEKITENNLANLQQRLTKKERRHKLSVSVMK